VTGAAVTEQNLCWLMAAMGGKLPLAESSLAPLPEEVGDFCDHLTFDGCHVYRARRGHPIMKRVAFFAFILLSACGGSSVPAGGYGKIGYGMSKSDLEKLGLTCQSATECSGDDFVADHDTSVPFGRADRVTANLSKGRVTSVDAIFLNYDYDELIDAYEKAYGKAFVCRHSNMLAAKIERHVWTASNGATVDVSKILDYGVATSLSGSHSSSATYREASESAGFKSKSC
jgi:hypothetical protein